MRFLPFNKKTRNLCYLALDIGTEAVKALVFEKENQQYRILGSALEYFDESRPFGNEKAILQAKEEAVSRAGKNPKELLLSFSPNILRSRIASFNISRQKPEEIITQKEGESALETAFKEIEKKITESFAKHSGIMPQDIKFTSHNILKIKIDGYEVSELLGFRGKNLEFKVLSSFLPRGYLENFNKAQIVNPIKNLSVLGATDGVFIDCGGDVTQICLIRNGDIEIVDEFEAGGRDFSRVISQTLGMRPQEARFFKERYSRGDLTDEARRRTKEILEGARQNWKSCLKSKLNGVKGLIPSTFFLFGGGSMLPEIEELIAQDEKEVKFVYPKDFKNIIDNEGCANSRQFTSLILIAHG